MNTNFFDLSGRKNPDVLYELLVDASREGIISKQELIALNKLITSMPADRESGARKKPPARTKKISARKETTQNQRKKTTCYLSENVSDRLEKTRKAVRSQVPEDLQAAISRSYIMDKALAVSLQEFEDKGKNSGLMRAILKNT